MRLNEGSKRVAIYLIYDKDGIISDYILYQLEDLIHNLEYILVVVNGKLTPDSRKRLKQYTNNILVRENIGFDIAGFKAGIEYIGWENIYQYDELLLMNDSCYGPIYPFKVIFDEMNNRDVDFWGLTMGNRLDISSVGNGKDRITLKDGYVPVHIQSYFRCIRKDLLCDNSFKRFWETQKDINTFWQAVAYHEIIFTKEFENKGFSWDVYVHSKEYEQWACSAIDYIPYLLLKHKQLPLIKRKNFFRDYEDSLREGGVDQFSRTIEYIEQNTKYDINLMWDDMVRVRNITEIHRKIRLNHILPLERIIFEYNKKNTEVAVFLFITSKVMLEYIIDKLFFPHTIDLHILTNDSELYEYFKKRTETFGNNVYIQLVSGRNNSLSTFLIECKDIFKGYEYVCYLNDQPNSEMSAHSSLLWVYNCVENLIGSENYINNVLGLFDKNKKIGLLFPPLPSNIYTYNVLGDEWENGYTKVEEFCEKYDINVTISQSESIIFPFGNMFWCRTEALSKMFNYPWKLKDCSAKEFLLSNRDTCKALERMYSLFAQNSGYLSGWVLNDIFASAQISDMYYSQRSFIVKNGLMNVPTINLNPSTEEIVKMYESSTSWKVTYPLRVIGKFWHHIRIQLRKSRN
ncbi:rhamnan synthesis F family protein [Lacrimispora sp.]|jgi:lipopolysaccharide biosynthesis protein|uniref:rhamnan synthesis F family protein n=1 Tax=Lacrimispora sp. TaxID=2719234 RepID=UPI0028AB91BD|nr:rhamnan synthesis F family protein [Lacrimispora sp.]